MGAVPRMLNLTHVGDQFSHFLHIQSSSNHHLQEREKKSNYSFLSPYQHLTQIEKSVLWLLQQINTEQGFKSRRTYKRNRRRNTVLTDFLQAREANICLTLEGLHMTPGQSLNMKISSSMSCGPKVQFLLVGNDINLTL